MLLIINKYSKTENLTLVFFKNSYILFICSRTTGLLELLGRRILLRRNRREGLILIVYVFIGSIIGGIVGKLLSYIPYFEFIDKIGKPNVLSVSFDPLFDINVIRFGFDLSLGINIGSIVGIIMAIAIWSRRR